MAHALPTDVYTPAELVRVLEQLSTRSSTGIRNRALLAVLWRGGLRCGEALALLPSDLDLARGVLRVRTSKTASGLRQAALDAQACRLLQAWTERRERLGLPGNAPLFCTLAGRPLYSTYVRALLPRLARAAGLVKRLHPHGLRHAHALELVREGVPLPLIRDQLGHASVATTDAYLRRLDPAERLERIHARTW